MQLESLANELLLDFFEYFNAVQLLRAFYGLNSRFDKLLSVYFRAYHLDFRSVSKRDFDLMCRQYLPSMVDRVISLDLSDDDETPNLPNLFLSYGFILGQFTHLRSILLDNLSRQDMENIILNCRSLPSFTHLKLTNVFLGERQHFVHFLDNIWSLPKLTNLDVETSNSASYHFSTLTVLSSTIEYVTMKSLHFSLGDLRQLLEYTPRLQHLTGSLKPGRQADPLPLVAPLITKLRIRSSCSLVEMSSFFQSMPNLTHLTVTTLDFLLNGHQWKEIIVNHLPKLRNFRLLTQCRIPNRNNSEEQVNELLNTFRTSFWLDEHRWFVRCEWYPETVSVGLSLYTLPYIFGDSYDLNPRKSYKSTCPDHADYWSYNHVSNVYYEEKLENWSLFPIRLPNVRHLTVRLPLDSNFWSIFPTLNQLTSLDVWSARGAATLSHLETLLDRAPHLYSLRVDEGYGSVLAQLQTSNESIRRVHSKYPLTEVQGDSNATPCSMWANSSLGRQCEVYMITIDLQTNVLDLVRQMPNLRALTIQYKIDELVTEGLSSEKDELVKRLQAQLPLTYLAQRQQQGNRQIRMWLE